MNFSKIYIYIILSVFAVASLSYYSVLLWGVDGKEIGTSAGGVIMNMLNGKGYFHKFSDEFNLYGHRFPVQVLIPVLLIKIIPDNLGLVFIVKNIIFLLLFLYAILRIFKYVDKLSVRSALFLSIVILNPSFIFLFSCISMEECYSLTFFALIFSFLLIKEENINIYKLILLFFAMFVFSLTKSSYLLLAFILPFMFFKQYHNVKLLYFGTAGVLSAYLIWGIWNYSMSSNFRITSSYDWVNFYKGNNELTDEYYIGDLDKLPNQSIEGNFSNEWEWADANKEKSLIFIKENPVMFLKLMSKKFYMFFIDFLRVEKSRDFWKYFIFVSWFLLLRLVFYCGIFIFFSSFVFKKNLRYEKQLFSFLIIIIIIYSLPFILGFAYIRHFLPLAILPFFISVYIDKHKEDNFQADTANYIM